MSPRRREPVGGDEVLARAAARIRAGEDLEGDLYEDLDDGDEDLEDEDAPESGELEDLDDGEETLDEDLDEQLEAFASRIHMAPSRALRAALQKNPDGRDHSAKRRIAVLEAEVEGLQMACVEAAISLALVRGAEATAAAIHKHRRELVEVMGFARVSERVCRGCGCTETNACPKGCDWVERDLCSSCVDRPRRRRG